MKRKRLINKLAIVVDQDIIEETTSEKLLGVVVNKKHTWKENLYGDNKNEGLITQLKIHEHKETVCQCSLEVIFTQN